jgi:hypothetical protein
MNCAKKVREHRPLQHRARLCPCQQGCQSFICATYQNGRKFNEWPQNVPNGHETYQMVVKYTEWPQTVPTMSIPRPPKIYPNRGFLVWKYTIWQPCMPELAPLYPTAAQWQLLKVFLSVPNNIRTKPAVQSIQKFLNKRLFAKLWHTKRNFGGTVSAFTRPFESYLYI